jgi:hypothetical protein
MKTSFILPGKSQQRLVSLLFFIIPLVWPRSATAQTPVTAVFTHFTNATTATSYTGTGATGNSASGFTGNTYTYEFGTNVSTTNNNQILDSFTALSENFHNQTVATMNVQFRRVNNASVTGLRKDMWYQSTTATVNSGGTAQLYPDYVDDSLELLFTRRLFNVGIDNVFQNATTTDNSNIERVDVIFPGGISATDNTKVGFTVFDRGNAGGHDPFYIAAITSLDGSGNPSGYDAAVSVTAANYGSGVGGVVNFITLRQNPGDPGLLFMDALTSQNRDGVLVRFTDLGVANNTRIYGYSLFETDDVFSPTSDMVAYTNAAYFPTTTDNGSSGGLDPLAIAGLWVTNASYVVLAASVESFTAVDVSGQVRLNWQLGVVDDESTLLVERSSDGASYTTLMEFPHATPDPQTAIDPHPLAGTNYYRLELVNAAGSVTAYSQICSIDNAVAAAGGLSLAIYPNPVRSGQLMIAAQGLTPGAYVLRLYDLSGTLVLSQDCSGGPAMNQAISLPDGLAAGIYSAQLADKYGHAVFVKHVLVE